MCFNFPKDKPGFTIAPTDFRIYSDICYEKASNNLNPYQGKVRIRACGILVEDGKILLVKHEGLGSLGYFWSPPGGGCEFGEPVDQTLKREFSEEVGLDIEAGEFAGFHEHIDCRFHAMELFFKVKRLSGNVLLGSDPENSGAGPNLIDVAWFSMDELTSLTKESLHSRASEFLRIFR